MKAKQNKKKSKKAPSSHNSLKKKFANFKKKKQTAKKEKHPSLLPKHKKKHHFSLFHKQKKESKKEKHDKQTKPEKKEKHSWFSKKEKLDHSKTLEEIKKSSEKKEVQKEAAKQEKPEQKKKFSLFKKKEAKPLSKKEQLEHDFLQKKLKKIKKKKRPLVQERKFKFKYYLDKAGIKTEPQIITKRIFNICVIITLLLSAYTVYIFTTSVGYTITKLLTAFLLIWTIFFGGLIVLIWGFLYFVLDFMIYQRKLQIEDVLPDYLQLTASNIKAGMTIDRALWYAVRPRFGVLANEIEMVAKQTMKGDDLKVALTRFSTKYDSPILKRSMSLLIEGIESGGEIGYLLNKIAINIQENKIMKREMAANVTTYVIFISFATVAAAPVLFALSGVLIKVISSLGSSLAGDTTGSGFAISFSGAGIDYTDFRIFAIFSLVMTSFFSGIIIATIVKGSAKEGFKYIPIFIIASILVFLAADIVLGSIVAVTF